MQNEAAIHESLTAWFSAAIAGFQQITAVEQLTAGASKQTFKIGVDTQQGHRSYALRTNGPESIEGGQVAQLTLATEARLIQLADDVGIPVPKIIASKLVTDNSHFDGFVMEWLNGEKLGHKIVRDQALQNLKPNLAEQCGEALGRIHQIDWHTSGLDKELPIRDPLQLVDEAWSSYAAYGVPMPMIDFTWRWLRDNIPEHCRQTLVHGDFRNGNLMIGEEGITGVLDWELAHIGDPLRDLGWLCVNSWRFGIADKEVGGFGNTSDLLKAYIKTTGIEVCRSELKFWQVFGSFWWSTTTLLMAQSWRTGANKSLERPAIGRRSSEAQMDCVNLIISGSLNLANQSSDLNHQQLPLASELASSVRNFLSKDLAGKLDPHDSFMARVAANSLAIIERELENGPRFAELELQSLKTILQADGTLFELRALLSSRLRDGLSLETKGLQSHLRNCVARQLIIDQPTYTALNAVN